MIETAESRAAFEKATGRTLGPAQKSVESSGAGSANNDAEERKTKAKGSRAAYMAAFRKRPVVCPACGHTFTKLKRAK